LLLLLQQNTTIETSSTNNDDDDDDDDRFIVAILFLLPCPTFLLQEELLLRVEDVDANGYADADGYDNDGNDGNDDDNIDDIDDDGIVYSLPLFVVKLLVFLDLTYDLPMHLYCEHLCCRTVS
jgi:hypothetical protein